jgi:hypothetical protein
MSTQPRPTGELAVYDGRNHAGTVRRRAGKFIACDARGRELGRFGTLKGAVQAIPRFDQLTEGGRPA